MSLLSLEKYLNGSAKPQPCTPEISGNAGYYALTCRLLAGIQDTVLVSEEVNDIAQDVHELRKNLQPNSSTISLDAAAQRFEDLLATLKTRSQQAEQERSADFRKILLILNEAFSHVNSGGERSDVRLKQMENSLQQAARTEDLRSLKGQLSKMLLFVRAEAQKESDHTKTSLQALGSQLEVAHKAASRFRGMGLASRENALTELARELADSENEQQLYIGIFVADSLRAVTSRHGKDTSERLLEEVGQKHILPHIPTASLFGWSANSLVSIWRSTDDFAAVSNYVANCFKLPVDHRAFVGTRVATFSISLRSLIMQGRKDVEEIISNLDRFGIGVLA